MNLKKNKVKLFNLIYILYKSLNNFIEKIEIKNNELIIYVNKNNLYIFNLFLKYHMKTQVKSLIDICTVDLLSLSDNNTTLKNRFEVVYSLISYKFNFRIRLKVFINNNELLYSLNKIYSSSLWLERENWDMYGIFFFNHPDLRRILTDYGFEGFPFRKDFPLSGYIELRYDDEKRVVVYEPIEITQEYRFFDFISPWDWQVK